MDIQELRYFIAAYEYGSYAKAAAEIFLSRQAMRQKLKCLEDELGGPLFISRKARLEPTELGRRLYKEARPIVSQFDAMELNMLSHSRHQKTSLTIAMGFGAATFLSLDPLLGFRREYPQIELTLSENSDSVVVSDVLSGHADLGIVGAFSDLLKELDAIKIQQSNLYLHIYKDNPLSRRQEILIPDLQGQPFISFGPQNHSHQFLLRECQACGFTPNFQFCVQDSQATHSIARAHNGITWTYPPKRLEYNAWPDFRVASLRFSDKSWGTYIIRRPGCSPSLSVRLLTQFLSAHATDV